MIVHHRSVHCAEHGLQMLGDENFDTLVIFNNQIKVVVCVSWLHCLESLNNAWLENKKCISCAAVNSVITLLSGVAGGGKCSFI